MKIKACPEGHDCTSNCRRNGCPCEEHKHTILSELGKMGGEATKRNNPNHFKEIAKKRWEAKKLL